MFTNIPRKDILILDNFIHSFSLDIENGIPIKPYYQGDDDYELEYLMEKLKLIKDTQPNEITLVDHVNNVLGLDEFYRYLGQTQSEEITEQESPRIEKKIARTSVIIKSNLISPPSQKNMQNTTPQKVVTNKEDENKYANTDNQRNYDNNEAMTIQTTPNKYPATGGGVYNSRMSRPYRDSSVSSKQSQLTSNYTTGFSAFSNNKGLIGVDRYRNPETRSNIAGQQPYTYKPYNSPDSRSTVLGNSSRGFKFY